MKTSYGALILIGCSALPALGQVFLPPDRSGPPKIVETYNDRLRRESTSKDRQVIRRRKTPLELAQASLRELAEMRRADEEDRLAHAEVLKAEDTGIFKLFPDPGCIEKVMRVDGDCAGFMPDSSSYTFRSGRYWSSGGDLSYFKNNFTSAGLFSQSVMTSLGEVPIEQLNETHPAVKALASLVPELTATGVESFAARLASGFETDGLRFADGLAAAAGPTFLLRKIEYRSSGANVPFKPAAWYESKMNIRDFLVDRERKDTIYAFRIVRNEDGVLTIVWKQLSRKDAPAVEFRKGEKAPILGTWERSQLANDARFSAMYRLK